MEGLAPPPADLPVEWTDDAVQVRTRPWPRDDTSLWWLVFEGIVGGAMALPMVLGAGLAVVAGGLDLPLQPLLGGLAIVTLGVAIGWVVGSTAYRNAWTLDVRCTPTLLQLRWRCGALPWSSEAIPLEHIRELRATREGYRQVPTLHLLRRVGGPAVRIRLKGATIEQVRWLVHLVDHARARNRAFWRDEFSRGDDEARRDLLALRTRGPRSR